MLFFYLEKTEETEIKRSTSNQKLDMEYGIQVTQLLVHKVITYTPKNILSLLKTLLPCPCVKH